MFENVKLDKSLYHLSNKSFLQSLTEQDPDENYIGTPYEGLDAFERQLKRFDIKTSGFNCDKVEKFFVTAESAVLFPEFVKRCIREGFESTVFKDLFAAKTVTNAIAYNPATITEAGALYNAVNQNSAFSTTTITSNATAVSLKKYGNTINASYEYLRYQNLDMFALILRNTGKRIGDTAFSGYFAALFDTITPALTVTTANLNYSSLMTLLSKFTNYRMTTLITGATYFSTVMGFSQLADCKIDSQGKVILPFGAEFILIRDILTNLIIAFDKDYALELITNDEVTVDTDRLITTQTDVITVSCSLAIRRIYEEAFKVIKVSTT